MTSLNPRYQLYADARLRGESQVAATLIAGYKESHARKQAVRLETNGDIRAYIEEHQAAASREVDVDVVYVMRGLKAIAEHGLQRIPVLAKDGIPVMAIDASGAAAELVALFDARNALSALERLGKQIGMFTDRIDHHMFVEEVREMAREAGVDESEAVAEAEAWLAQQ